MSDSKMPENFKLMLDRWRAHSAVLSLDFAYVILIEYLTFLLSDIFGCNLPVWCTSIFNELDSFF